MGLELQLSDRFGNKYPSGYRRLAYFGIEVDRQTIVIVFNNYPDQDERNANPENFFDQTTYRITGPPQPEVRDAQGNVTRAEIPAFSDFIAHDMKNPQGTFATIYGFVKAQPDNAGARDVL